MRQAGAKALATLMLTVGLSCAVSFADDAQFDDVRECVGLPLQNDVGVLSDLDFSGPFGLMLLSASREIVISHPQEQKTFDLSVPNLREMSEWHSDRSRSHCAADGYRWAAVVSRGIFVWNIIDLGCGYIGRVKYCSVSLDCSNSSTVFPIRHYSNADQITPVIAPWLDYQAINGNSRALGFQTTDGIFSDALKLQTECNYEQNCPGETNKPNSDGFIYVSESPNADSRAEKETAYGNKPSYGPHFFARRAGLEDGICFLLIGFVFGTFFGIAFGIRHAR